MGDGVRIVGGFFKYHFLLKMFVYFIIKKVAPRCVFLKKFLDVVT